MYHYPALMPRYNVDCSKSNGAVGPYPIGPNLLLQSWYGQYLEEMNSTHSSEDYDKSHPSPDHLSYLSMYNPISFMIWCLTVSSTSTKVINIPPQKAEI
jgi:hypothetical protein